MHSHITATCRAEREQTIAATEQLLNQQKRAHNDAILAMEKRLEAKVRKQVEQMVPQIHKTVTAEVRSQLKVVQQSLEGQVRAEVRDTLASEDAVVGAFRQSFQSLIIPSFESATQRMFTQINDAVVKGVAESVTTGVNGSLNGSRSVRASTDTATVPSLTPEEELGELLDDNQYDEAFMKALGAKDLGLVTWLCKQLDTAMLFGDGADEHPPLSQTVLVCLLQQLGAQLSTDTTLKLEWMKEIALNLDKDNEDIATYAPDVLKQLTVAMKEFAATNEGRLHSTELRLLMRVL